MADLRAAAADPGGPDAEFPGHRHRADPSGEPDGLELGVPGAVLTGPLVPALAGVHGAPLLQSVSPDRASVGAAEDQPTVSRDTWSGRSAIYAALRASKCSAAPMALRIGTAADKVHRTGEASDIVVETPPKPASARCRETSSAASCTLSRCHGRIEPAFAVQLGVHHSSVDRERCQTEQRRAPGAAVPHGSCAAVRKRRATSLRYRREASR